jgi:hypothetical protein
MVARMVVAKMVNAVGVGILSHVGNKNCQLGQGSKKFHPNANTSRYQEPFSGFPGTSENANRERPFPKMPIRIMRNRPSVATDFQHFFLQSLITRYNIK